MPLFPPKECGYSLQVQLSTLHLSGEVAFKPRPTLSILLWGDIWLPGNYSWSNCGISVPEEIFGFLFFLLGWNKDCRVSYKITKKLSVETFHCNIIQVLNLEPGGGYRTFTQRVTLVFCSMKVKMDHLELIKTLLHLFGKQSFCRKLFVWQASFWQDTILNGKIVQLQDF